MKRQAALIVAGLALAATGGCQLWRNAEAYFNIYYNMQRLMGQVEEEFGYYDETRRTQRPRVLVADPTVTAAVQAGEILPFLQEFVIEPPKLQPVQKQLDSILQKGSKILAFRARSDFVDDALLLMAQAFFYRGEWLPAQIKCQELLQLFPMGELAPDAQLLLAKAYLMQRKVSLGQQALSRAIDIAWYRRRFDILSQAFRLQAELALSQGDLEGACRPYRQAILREPDAEARARWQWELAAILYRMGRFEEAAAAFAEVFRYRPTLVVEYEAKLYRAAALARLGRFREAEELLNELKRRRRYEQWMGYTLAQELALRRLMQASADTLQQLERRADSAFPGNPLLLAVQYEHALGLLQRGEYRQAQRLFARASVTRSPVFQKARSYSELLARWEQAMATLGAQRVSTDSMLFLPDSLRARLSQAYYELGRVQTQLGRPDSAEMFYARAARLAPDTGLYRPRALFAQALTLSSTQPARADSLLEELAECCPRTPYGQEAQRLLGYTPDALVDTAAELYESGLRLWRVGEYALARQQWLRIAVSYPASPYAPKALYALGWMYESPPLRQLDSALFYYSQLVERYPNTEYAADVRLSVAHARAKQEGTPPEKLLPPKPEPQTSPPSSPAPPVLQSQPEPPPVMPTVPSSEQGTEKAPPGAPPGKP
jgi:tetratricopeptide (TPR) repeat protein